MHAVIDKLREERDESVAAAVAIAEAPDFDPTSQAFVELEQRSESLNTQIEHLVKLHERRQAADALDGRLGRQQQHQQEREAAPPEKLSWGELWVRSEQFAQYPARGTSQRLEIETRALPATLASMADGLPSAPVYDLTPPAPPPSLLPLVTVVNVSGNSVDFIRWEKVTAPAAPKSSAKVVPETESKPDIEFRPVVESSSLDTIAGATSYSRQMAQDAAAIVSYINGELQAEVSRKIEEEAQAALAAATLATVSGDDLLVALRMGMAAVAANGFVANGFTASAEDIATMDIAAMNASNGGPTRSTSFWGLTPVVDWTKSAGDPLTVGDFKRAVQHYRRTSVELFTTDSHGTHFKENILDTIAEARAKTVVVRPDALVEASAA